MSTTLKLSPLLPVVLAVSLMACGKPATPTEAASTTPPAAATATSPAIETMPAASSTPSTETAAAESVVTMNLISASGVAADAGTVTISDGPDGLMLKANLKGLPAGEHGFHVHQNPDCGVASKDGKTVPGGAAGEHYDPTQQGKHAGPDGMGHAGDLPRITVAADGTATSTVSAAKLKLADLKNRSLMIHSERDDYAAAPGGERIACGVIR